MRKFFSFRSSYGSGNDNVTPSDLSKGRKKANSTAEINAKTSSQENRNGGFSIPEDCVLKPLNQNLEVISSNPYLRRSLSLTSATVCGHLNEGSLSSSSDQSRVAFRCDNDQHMGQFSLHSHGSFTPDRYPRAESENLQLNADEKQSSLNSYSIHQNSPDSNSACSTPIPFRCRSTHEPQLSHNHVLDLYIDGEHGVTEAKNGSNRGGFKTREDNEVVIRNKTPFTGRPPRASSTELTSPHCSIDSIRSYSFREIRDKRHHFSSRDWINGDSKPAFEHKCSENNIERTSCDSRMNAHAYVEDILEDSSVDAVPGEHCSLDLIPIDKKFHGNCLYEPFDLQSQVSFSRIGPKATEHDELINFKLQGQDSNEDLLKKLRELEERDGFLTKEDSEYEKLRPGSLNEAALVQNMRKMNEDRRHLVAELSSQLRSRLIERSFANDRLKKSKLDLITRTRRLENEKNELQLTLENELDRRSNEWSLKLSKFQGEEQRLRERVRELAEQNVSLQREISSLQGSDLMHRNSVVNLERQLNESRASQDELKAENFNIRQALLELQERCNGAEEQRDLAISSSKEIERGNIELQRLVSRLQRTCSEQDKVICELRQSYSNELEKKFVAGGSDIVQLQTEKLRLIGVEQKLWWELESCRIEMESLRNENFNLLNRLQGTENARGLSFVRLNVELCAWIDCLKMQSLSLLHDSSHFCGQLLDFIACKRAQNCEHTNKNVDEYSTVDLTYRYQDLRRAIGNYKRSLKIVSTTIEEKVSIQASKYMCPATEIDSSKHQKGDKQEGEIEMELKAEGLLTKLLKERICYRELEIEQLQRDLASLVRSCDMLRTDFHRLKDEVSCLNHKKRDMEIQMSNKDENLSLMQQELQELRGLLTNVSEERDRIRKEMQQLRESNMKKDCELKSLHKKIELLDEDVLYKEGQITILKDSLGNKPFGIL